MDKVIMVLMMAYALMGAFDRIRGNRLGYGEAFEEGFRSMGTLALAIAAVYASSPLLSEILTPVASVFLEPFGIDRCVLPGLILSSDMGAYTLALSMTDNAANAAFSGLILGGTIGSTWIFTIPVALSILRKEDLCYLSSGLLCGLVTMPAGIIAGGAVMHFTPYRMEFQEIVRSTLPVIVLSAIVGLGLWFRTDGTIRFFAFFGKIITAAVTALTAIAAFEEITGITFPVLDTLVKVDDAGLTGLDRGLVVCGQVSLVLSGAFPMVKFITRHFSPVLSRFGTGVGVNTVAASGFLSSAANIIPMYSSYHDMDEKGRILNAAFAAAGAFVLGDHLGFTAGVNQSMVIPLITAKFTAGISAVILASFMSPLLIRRCSKTS